jgi:hypothetical protein
MSASPFAPRPVFPRTQVLQQVLGEEAAGAALVEGLADVG